MKALAIITFVLTFGASAPVFAEPIGVKFTEGVSHAFPSCARSAARSSLRAS